MREIVYVAKNKDTFLSRLWRLLTYLIMSVVCFFIDHKWGEWYKGEVGKDIWKEEHECQRCHKIEGRGGILPPEPWPDPPERNE